MSAWWAAIYSFIGRTKQQIRCRVSQWRHFVGFRPIAIIILCARYVQCRFVAVPVLTRLLLQPQDWAIQLSSCLVEHQIEAATEQCYSNRHCEQSHGKCHSWATSHLSSITAEQRHSWAVSQLSDVTSEQRHSWAASHLSSVTAEQCHSWAASTSEQRHSWAASQLSSVTSEQRHIWAASQLSRVTAEQRHSWAVPK